MGKSKLFAIVFLAVFLVACQGLGGDVDRSDISGIYYLVKVDGAAVPTEVDHDGVALQVQSGVFIISDDGTCFSRTEFVPPDGDQITREVHADYRIEDALLIMQWEGAGVTEGTVDGDTFVMDNHGMVFEYSRSG